MYSLLSYLGLSRSGGQIVVAGFQGHVGRHNLLPAARTTSSPLLCHLPSNGGEIHGKRSLLRFRLRLLSYLFTPPNFFSVRGGPSLPVT